MKHFLILCSLFFICTNLSFSQEDVTQETDTTFQTQPIEVDALKGIERKTPVAFQDINREEIVQKYWMQDLPMFLNGKTSLKSYSESGASIGYSYLSLRGFDQRRISILINGTPQNDAEDQQVYWVDLSDITSSVENIQIQRGVGTGLYGTSSIGGVINIQTIDYTRRNFLNVNVGAGDYNSKRYSFEYSSGLAKNNMGFYAKFSKTTTDGYRDLSWSDHWSYFIGATKLFKNSTLKMNVYGSPIKNHLAYLGVIRDYLDGKVTGDKLVDRRYNPLTYYDETDNYHQPHYELIYNWQPTKNVYISNTVSYTRGEGFFVTSFPAVWGLDFSYFRLNPFFTSDTTTFNPLYYKRNPDGSFYFEPGNGYVIDKSDMITKLYVNNNDYGWYPKVQITHNNDKGTLVIGGEVRMHKSEHYGEIAFANALPQNTPPNYEYYYYNGKKRSLAIYANEIYNINDNVTAMVGLQYANHRYSLENDKFKPYGFDVNYDFFTPRVGLNVILPNNLRFFGNVSYVKREPRLKDIYDAESPYSTPNFRVIDTVNNVYQDPLVKPEELIDYELGINYKTPAMNTSLNFYLMDFSNEIVSNGQLDNVGQPINGNAGKSVHRGIEFESAIVPFYNSKVWNKLSLEYNITLSENYFKEYTEILGRDSIGNVIYGNDYSGNQILLNPSVLGNLTLNYYDKGAFNAYVTMQHVGKQYLDNSENERKNPSATQVAGYVDKFIEPYIVFNGGISYNFMNLIQDKSLRKSIRNFDIEFKINNIFDKLYETTGSVDSYGIPYWIPAATRNFYANVKIGF
jgi:iron complex outermembrane receptor protein